MVFSLASFDDLGFPREMKLVLELFGRNANLILLDSEGLIVDSLKKTYLLGDEDKRIIVPKARYAFPENQGRINPFDRPGLGKTTPGVFKILFSEILFQNDVGIVKRRTEPVLIKAGNKYYFYCFPLYHLGGELTAFPTLSELLEHYYVEIRRHDVLNSEQKKLEHRIQREMNRISEKLRKQKEEYREAQEKLSLEKTGNLLSSNLHLVPKGADSVEVEDFYEGGEKVLIPLNPLLSPAQNLEEIFSKYKKAKRAVGMIEEQIKATEAELLYWETSPATAGTGISEIRES